MHTQTIRTRRQFRKHEAIACACALAISMPFPSIALAHNFCVASAADLQNALTAASDGGLYNGEDNIVIVQQGTYSTSNNGGQRFYYRSTAAHYLDIQGGWSNNCTTANTNAIFTVLDGNHDSAVLDIHSAQGSVTVRYLTIQNGFWANAGLAGGLTINNDGGDLGIVSVTYTIIRNNASTSTPAGIFGGAAGIYLTNSLITGNATGGDGGAGELFVTSQTHVTNNTIANNTNSSVSGAGGLILAGGFETGYASNNIFWGNTRAGLELFGDAIVLVDNDYGLLGGTGTPAAGSIGNFSLDPQFINAGSGNYRLAGNSPALAVGTSSPQGGLPLTDLAGCSRPQHGGVDLGAYEETIFIDGFGG
jgi:hypothetical protein